MNARPADAERSNRALTQQVAINQHTTGTMKIPWARLSQDRYPTTSFLTATTLIYTCAAGITAAAGTRLALHWILVKVFKLYSFRLAKL